MEKRAFWMALIALMLSIITLAIIVMDVWSISVIDSNTFISAIVGLMTLVFTLLVGYQIYNAITAREKMEAMRGEIDARLKEVEIIKGNVEALTNEFRQGGYILQARIEAKTPMHQYVAFLKMLSAIRAALDVDNRDEGYGWMMNELKEYMLLLNNTYPFSGSSDVIPKIVEEYRNKYKNDDIAIRKHDNYYIIRDTYEPLMADFEKRLDGIAQMKAMSLTEVGEELKVE
jgi:hypothetical protein